MDKKDFIDKFMGLYKKNNKLTKTEEEEIIKMIEEKIKDFKWIRD